MCHIKLTLELLNSCKNIKRQKTEIVFSRNKNCILFGHEVDRQLRTLCTIYKLPSGSSASKTRMWANAQRDGRPAEYRWRPVLNAAKFGSRPLLECRAVTLPIGERKTWRTQTEFCTRQNSVTGQQPPKMYV